MTSAPGNLLDARNLLLQYLNPTPGAPASDLEPAEVGIVGNPEHKGGYHCGSDRTVRNDYSVVESPRDRAGLTSDAAALDVGGFEVRSLGAEHNLRTFSAWCVAQCRANSADSRDIREIIYSIDGKTVRRWDRLGKRTGGDSSHLWHTHFSFFRDAVKAGRDQRPLYRRYLTEIGLIKPALTAEEKDMAFLVKLKSSPDIWISNGVSRRRLDSPYVYDALKQDLGLRQMTVNLPYELDDAAGPVDLVFAGGVNSADVAGQVVAGVLAVLTPAAIADAVPDEIAADLADLLAARLAK